jgi:hypothetical protein
MNNEELMVEDMRRVQTDGMREKFTFVLVGLITANANAVLLKPSQIIGSLKCERTH